MKTSNKGLLIGLLISIALVLGVVFVMQAQTKKQVALPSQTEDVKEEQGKDFVVDVDQNIDHWQTKEIEHFTIKFPKEWYWLESDRKKTGYYSQVITNNPDFDIDKYSDIGIFTGSEYLYTSTSEGVISMQLPLQDNEIVISTNNLGWLTSDTGTPYEFMESIIKRTKKLHPSTECNHVSNPSDIPLITYCSFVKSGQKIQTVYVSNIKRTFAITARTSEENTTEIQDILKQIAKSYQLKDVSI